MSKLASNDKEPGRWQDGRKSMQKRGGKGCWEVAVRRVERQEETRRER